VDKKKQLKLMSKGWAVGDASDFLGLSKEETEFVELKVSLAKGLQKKHQEKGVSRDTKNVVAGTKHEFINVKRHDVRRVYFLRESLQLAL
jgi:hypothetical protein